MSDERVTASVKRDHIHLMNKLFKWDDKLNKWVAQPDVFFNTPDIEIHMGNFVGALNYFENQQYPEVVTPPPQSTVQDFRTSNDFTYDLKWGMGARWATSGGVGNDVPMNIPFSNNCIVWKLTIPKDLKAYPLPGKFTACEYQGPPNFKQLTVSRHLADFRPTDKTGNNGPLDQSMGLTPTVNWNTGLDGVYNFTVLNPGETYYINLRNVTTNGEKIPDSENNVVLNSAFEAGFPYIPTKGPIVPNY